MMQLLHVEFPYTGPWGTEMATAMHDLAHSIAKEPGLIWKIWIENKEAGMSGGTYLFRDRASAEAYLAMHTERLKSFGIPEVRGTLFAVNTELSHVDRAPI